MVVKRKFFQTNHSEHPELFQKNVLGIIEGFTKTGIKRKKIPTNHSEMVAFSKKLSLVLCGQLFIKVAKTLPLCPLLYIRFHGKQQKFNRKTA